MLQPRLGRWTAPTARPERTASTASRRSRPDGRAVPWPTAVELTAVDELPIPSEEEEVRRAGGAIGLRDRLGLVVEVGKDVARRFRLLRHLLGPIVRIRRDVVRVDRDDPEPSAGVVAAEAPELVLDVLDVGAVVADEHHEEGLIGRVVVACDHAPGRVRQAKVGRRGAQLEHRRGSACHGTSSATARRLAPSRRAAPIADDGEVRCDVRMSSGDELSGRGRGPRDSRCSGGARRGGTPRSIRTSSRPDEPRRRRWRRRCAASR